MKSSNLTLFIVAFIFTAFVFSPQLYASVSDLPDVGGKGYFRDDVTMRVWQDIDNFFYPEAEDVNYYDIISELSGTGFHLATRSEIDELIAHAPYNAGDFPSYKLIMGGTSLPRDILYGIFDDGDPSGNYGVGIAYMDSRPTHTPGWYVYNDVVSATASLWSQQTPDHDLGAWVVADQVPIPGAVWLLGSGLIGLIGLRKKVKK